MADIEVTRHFDTIARRYYEEIPAHVREHLFDKWWSLVSKYFSEDAYVLDMGCGDGTNVRLLREKGIRAIGVDASAQLIQHGKRRYPELEDHISVGDALRLPFGSDTFDAVYMVGLLHHIHSKADQARAVREGLRVMKKEGRLIIRECNTKNPLFRLFWNYVFPLTARIDRFGGENWIRADFYRNERFHVDQIYYFTFLPNFTPRGLLPYARRLEAYLEGGFFKSLAAHYIAVLRK